MDQNRWNLGIDRQGVVLLLIVTVLGLVLGGAALWIWIALMLDHLNQ
jgi:hypothetical protein